MLVLKSSSDSSWWQLKTVVGGFQITFGIFACSSLCYDNHMESFHFMLEIRKRWRGESIVVNQSNAVQVCVDFCKKFRDAYNFFFFF